MQRSVLRTAVLALASVAALCAPSRAAQRREVAATRLATPIDVDGKLDEAAWRTAPEYADFVDYYAPKPTPADPQTAFRLLYDAEALYLGVTVTEPLMRQLRAKHAAPDADLNVYADDSIELMLAPGKPGSDYAHFFFNALGNYGDRIMRHGGSAADATWNTQIDSAGTRLEDRWIVEARIPFSQLPLAPGVGKAWGFQIVRNRRAVTGRPIISLFQKASGGFHDATQFAHLTGLDVDFSKRLCRAVDVRVRSISTTPGTQLRVAADVYVENMTQAFVAFELVGHAAMRAGERVPFSVRGGLDHDEVKAFPIELVLAAPGQYLFDCEVRKLPERWAMQTAHLAVDLAKTELEIVLHRPDYRRTIYPDQTLAAVELSLRTTLADKEWEHGTLELSLLPTQDERVLATASFADLSELSGQRALPLPELPHGDYRVRARIVQGQTEKARAETELHVIRDAPFFYRIDEYGRLIKNGKPQLIVGIEGGFQFERLAALGFNYTTLIGQYRKTRDELQQLVDRASRHGMMIGFNVADFAVKGKLGHRPLPPDNAAKIREKVELSRGIEAIALWMLRDEPENRNILPELFEASYTTLCEADPLRPVGITNCSHTGLLMYARSGDIRRPDPYPGFWDDGSWFAPPTFVSDRLDQAFSTPAERRICAWPILQTFGYNDARTNRGGPAFQDVRNVTWLAVVHGARCLSYYSWNGIHANAELSEGVPALLKEIWALEPFILATADVPAESSSDAVHVLARSVAGETIVCAVNVTEEPVTTELCVPALADSKLTVVSENRTVQAAGGRFRDPFGPTGVHIYSTNPNRGAGLSTLAELAAAIAAEEQRRANPANLAYCRHTRQISFSPNAKVRRTRAPFDGAVEGYGWMPMSADPRHKEPVWMEVTFDAPKRIERIRAVVREIKKYTLTAWDGREWRTLEGATSQRRDQQDLCTLYDTRIALDPPELLEKVRFTVPQPTRPRLWLSLQELEVLQAE